MTTIPAVVQDAYGSLPDSWRLEKVKFFAEVRNSNVDKLTKDYETPVRLCNYTDVYYNDRIAPDLDFMEATATKAEIERFQLRRGQVILTKDSESWNDIGIPALVTEDMPEVLCGYHLTVFEPKKELDGGFLAWLCRSEPLNDQFKVAANGVTRYGLGMDAMKNAFMALPPLDVQRRIARFLDEKSARIDGLIGKKKELLDRLAEKRQALITRAVTQGLDDATQRKPSGQDWMGDVPAHWEVLPLRRVAIDVATGRTPPSADSDYFSEGELNWFTPGDFTAEIELRDSARKITPQALEDGVATLFPPGTTMLVGIGATLGKVAVSVEPGSANQQINAIILEVGSDPHYLAYFLHGFRQEVRVMSNGNTLGILNQDGTKALVVLRPPLEEQQRIAAFLQDQDSLDAEVRVRVQRSLELLAEHRGALVSAAVTGQIEGLR